MSEVAPPGNRGHAWAVPVLLLGILGICVGTLLVPYSTHVGPVATAFWRMILSWPVFALCAWHFRSRADRRLSAAAGACFGIDLAFYHTSLLMTTAANACLLSNSAPVIVTVVAVWLGMARNGWRTWAALVIAVGGAAMLVKGSPGAQAQSQLTGDTLALFSAVGYAGYQLAATRARRTGGALGLLADSSLVASAVLLPIALLLGEQIIPSSSADWGVIVGLAVFGQIIGQGLIVWSLAHLPSAYSSLALLLQPALVAIIAWPLFGQTMVPIQILGGGVLLAGVWWAKKIHKE